MPTMSPSFPLSADAAPVASPNRTAYLLGAVAAIFVTVAVAAFSLHLAFAEREATLRATVEARLAALATGRAQTLGTWIEGGFQLGNRLVRSDLVQLFVAEHGLAGADAPLDTALAQQLPYMRQVVDEFAAQHDLVSVHLLDAEGDTVAADRDAPPLSAARRNDARAFLAGGGARRAAGPRTIGPSGKETVVDLKMAIPLPQTLDGKSGAAGVLLMTVRADGILGRTLDPSSLDLPGEAAWLRPLAGAGANTGDGRLRDGIAASPPLYPAAEPLADGERFAVTAAVPGADWQVVQGVDRAAALLPLTRFKQAALIATLVGCLLIAAAFLVAWQRQHARHFAEMAGQYKVLAATIQEQRRLLATVASSSYDAIGLKGGDGRYLFANEAFAAMLRHAPNWIVGRRDEEIFAPATVRILAEGERQARTTGLALREAHAVEVAGRERHLHMVQVPVAGEDGSPDGALFVARDVSDLVAERLEHEALMEQLVGAVIRAVELNDPYLLGHTRRLGDTALAIADAMGLAPDERRTLKYAAGLSQIGKMFVPREIVAKPDRHTPEEARLMRTHIDHALKVVEGIDFKLPVAETLAQMHERLDGSGYPHGLEAARIGRLGRILAVADVFCARTQPRGYRDATPPAHVLRVLQDNAERYDPAVVEVLAKGIERAVAAPV
ncbi:MAG: PAS domain-containing protein [Geminicoccaceae bacterium]|nr:PAS domain-containing protein [Geminicoccaceae bacterium]